MRFLVALLSFWIFPATASCAAPVPARPARSAVLPRYVGREAVLFDDRLERPGPRSLAEAMSAQPVIDPALRERVRLGDRVVRARVVTFTSRRTDAARGWVIVVRPIEHLAGKDVSADDLSLELQDGPWASELAAASQAPFVGSEVVAFTRAFDGFGGGPAVHFHLLRADKPQLLAIRNAALLAQVE